jgi:phenylalanyl-tRNA synthetase beta subunit
VLLLDQKVAVEVANSKLTLSTKATSFSRSTDIDIANPRSTDVNVMLMATLTIDVSHSPV